MNETNPTDTIGDAIDRQREQLRAAREELSRARSIGSDPLTIRRLERKVEQLSNFGD